MHPPHQVAQKSSRITFPLYADNLIGVPLESMREKSGAGLPMEGGDGLCVQAVKSRHSATNTNGVNARNGIENPQRLIPTVVEQHASYKGSLPDVCVLNAIDDVRNRSWHKIARSRN